MLWDIFISHASEDKEAVVRPLVERLEQRGLTVWLDEQQLRLGDKLSQKINQALSLSRFAVVVLSDAFLSKDYPQKELSSLLSRETVLGGYILPVLHDLTHEDVKARVPLLGDNLAVSTARGLDHVASEIFRAVSIDRDGDQSPAPIRYFPQFDFPEHLIASAADACTTLAKPETWDHLQPKRDMTDSMVWMGTDSAVIVKLLYDLYCPLMLYRQISYALRRSLSSFTPPQRYRFALLEAMFRALTCEQDLAASGSPIEYTPRVPRWREKRDEDPARYWWQGISEERFDDSRGAFVREAEAELNVTMFTFQEFRSKYHAAYVGDGNSQKSLGLLANALFGYTPVTRPVYSRLVTLWYACNATFLKVDDKAQVHADFPMSNEQIASFVPKINGAESADDVYRAIHEYWSDLVRPRLSRCMKGPRETNA